MVVLDLVPDSVLANGLGAPQGEGVIEGRRPRQAGAETR